MTASALPTRATICMLLFVWLELCITLTDAGRRGGGGGGSRGSSSSSSLGSSGGGGGSSSKGVGGSIGTGGRSFLFFGSGRHAGRNHNSTAVSNEENDDDKTAVWSILFWVMIGLCGICGMIYYCMRNNSNYRAYRFNSRVSKAKNQVKRQGFKSKTTNDNGGNNNNNNNNSNIGRPPADGSYVATYAIKGQAYSSTTTLSFSPNMEDSHTSWLISGSGRNTNLVALGDNNLNACTEFTITEGTIAESGHAYWVQQKPDGGNDSRSLTTGKFEFDDESASNWCSFTGKIKTSEGDQAEYTSFQLEKDSVVVHGASYATTDLESNDDGDNATASAY